ncbi:signal recognition particle-docking protein FtsY [Spirulina sp. CS-785/01]|uniref:signal recognition particle-docking protein FtsY n=1 Tax=Spirulina sp. CS-785/01 TaxID=3021716 RepID=UPI00232C32FA|nr:signal recognition particle-docking protein FtsY [Spirulina sp. CS-785/01]MDB9314515.1 signal recognition particle-docking protein FtsY [Spirulina sp. CS-785/01]
MFNWFNRKFGKRDKEDSQKPSEESKPSSPASEEAEESPETQDSSTATTEDSTSTTPDDYLQWAKAAYQNIQKRQTVEKEPEPEQEAEEPEPEQEAEPETVAEPEPVAETEPETVAELEPEQEAEPETVEEPEPVAEAEPEQEAEELEPEQEAEPETVEEPEPVAEAEPETVEEPEPVAEAEPETPEEPEPVAETEPETPEEPEAPVEQEQPTKATPAWLQQKSDGLERLRETAIEEPEEEVALDEDFVWSARVLAEQGRSPDEVSLEEISWLKRLREGLGKTRRSLVNQLKAVVGQGPLNEEAVMEIEALLLQADIGVEATDYIVETLQDKLREEALPPEAAIAYLKKILCDVLDRPLPDPSNAALVPEPGKLNVWLITGVNGAGKTTTIGKIAHMAQKSGYPSLIAAADTFRAAAVEQVKVWGERANTAVIANPGKNTDPAAVVYDAIAAAQSRQTELLLVDTAGRLQNKKNLMEELGKIRRIIDKKAPDAVIESLLVLDATLGQNGLRQAQVFSEVAQLSGVVLTKLDGTSKGGVALAVAQQLDLPIRFIGAGEGIEDLRPFSSYEFVEALLSE